MMHMATHLIDYMRWYNGNANASWVMAQAAAKANLKTIIRLPIISADSYSLQTASEALWNAEPALLTCLKSITGGANAA
jgi:hypothetical protein